MGSTPSDPPPKAADSLYWGGSEPRAHCLFHCGWCLGGCLLRSWSLCWQAAPGKCLGLPHLPSVRASPGVLLALWGSRRLAHSRAEANQVWAGPLGTPRNPEVPACAFPRSMSSPGEWLFPGLWVTADMASDVYRKGPSTHNTRKGARESVSRAAECSLGGVPPPTSWQGGTTVEQPGRPASSPHWERAW